MGARPSWPAWTGGQRAAAEGGAAGLRRRRLRGHGCFTTQAADLAARIGAPLSWPGSRSRRPDRARARTSPGRLLTTDAQALVTAATSTSWSRSSAASSRPARCMLAAMKRGKSVVTANKALLAEDGATLHAAAREHGVDLYYEAAVAGAIPLLRPLRESLAGDGCSRVLGIVNGTTNYILDRMDTTGRRLRRGAGRGAGTGLRRGRPDRRHRGLRRRRQGRDPGRPGLPHPGHRRRRVPGGHHRGHRGRHRQRPGDGPRGQAARHLRAPRRRPGCRSGCTRR